jgi:outer membrane protein assembly factor BamB
MVGPAWPVFGQGFGLRQEFSAEANLIQAPREVERLLEQAEEAISAEEWTEATLALGMLLGIEEQPTADEFGQQDYFQAVDRQSVERGSLRQAAAKLIDDLPEAGMKVFELRYGSAAGQKLSAAITAGDWREVEDVARLYRGTASGREAAWLTAESHAFAGRPWEAAVGFDRLMRQPRSVTQFGLEGFLAGAACWKVAGQNDKALELLRLGQTAFPATAGNWQGVAFNMARPVEDLLAAIEFKELNELARKESMARWIGGTVDRNGDYAAGIPLPLINWKYPMHESEQHELATLKTIKQKVNERSVSLIPSRAPIVVPPWILVMSYDQRLNAIHMKTGKLMWTASFNRLPYSLGSERWQYRDQATPELPVPDYLARRVWGEAALGQLSSDGRQVYSLSELPSMEASDSTALGAHANVIRPLGRRLFNVLQAWSIEAQGKLLWEVGGETGLADERLAGVLFLGTPIFHQGELLVLGELNGEVYLFSLNPADGRLGWKQQLVANPAVPIAGDNLRRNLSCSPAIAGDRILCPTLSGQLVAVDRGTRSLCWAHRYEQAPEAVAINQFNAWGTATGGEFQPLQLRSAEAAVIVSGGCVIHAPCDGHQVYALDLFSGSKLWEIPRSNALYVAGIWRDRVLLIQDQLVTCVQAIDGAKLWASPIALAGLGRVAGRGVRDGGRYYLPMTSQEILEIDLETGSIVDRIRVKEPLGNLVATADQLISLSPVELAAFSIRDRLRAEIDLEFAQNVGSSGRLQREGKVLLAEGKISEALDVIERAYREHRDDPEVQFLLKEVALMALQQDFQKYASRVAEYEELIQFGPERSVYLVSVIDGMLRQGEYVRGVTKLLELIDSHAQGVAYGSFASETIEPESNLQVRHDLWIAAKLAQAWEAAAAEDRLAIERLIAPRLPQGIGGKPTLLKSRPLDDFRWLPMAAESRLADAARRIEDRDWLIAEQTIGEVLEVAGNHRPPGLNDARRLPVRADPLLHRAEELRFSLYNQLGRWLTTVPLAAELDRGLDEIQVEPQQRAERSGGRGLPSAQEALPNREDFVRWLGGLEAWPRAGIEVQVKPLERPLLPVFGGVLCQVKQRVGGALEDWSITVQQNSIDLLGPTGQQRLTTKLDSRFEGGVPPTAHVIDSIVVIETQRELIAMDSLRASEAIEAFNENAPESLIWREAFGRSIPEDMGGGNLGPRSRNELPGAPRTEMRWGERRYKNRKGFAVGPATRTGILVAANGQVISLDPRTGGRRWSRSGFGTLPGMVQDGDTLVVLDTENFKRTILDARDGKLRDVQDWSDKFEVWCSFGRHVLSTYYNRKEDEHFLFKLWDAVSGETLLERDFSSEFRANICQDGQMVALSPKGELVFWDLKGAKEEVHSMALPAKLTLKSLAVERFGKLLLVMTEGTAFGLADFVRTEETSHSLRCRGPMIALRVEDGRPLWEAPRMIYDYLFPLSQLRSSPIVSLVRPLRFKAGGKIPAETGSMALLDIRDGSLLYANDYLDSVRGLEFQSQLRLGPGSLRLQYRGSDLEVSWRPPGADRQTEPGDDVREIGKIERSELESQTPADLLQRLQSGVESNLPPSAADYFDRLFRNEIPQPQPR